jgi:hypothetical protein
MGIITGSRNSWKEQVGLVLKNAGEKTVARYRSPVCTTSVCIYTIGVKPGHGSWTVLPEWFRYHGSYQSAGHEPGLIRY